MWLIDFKLIEKTKLNKEVYLLVFFHEEKIISSPGQFITFVLPELWWRAYSILDTNENITHFIIKRVKNGRWWSKYICDSKIWTIIKWAWPAWHFVLRETTANKLFLWTWTWIVPLYNQIKWWIDKELFFESKLVFWVRTLNDLFYIKELTLLNRENHKFDIEIFLSREDAPWYHKWYVTDYLTKDNIASFSEFYICWTGEMLDSCIEKLKNLWVSEDYIYFERY
jgi:NAD(P)H-flavin reductase